MLLIGSALIKTIPEVREAGGAGGGESMDRKNSFLIIIDYFHSSLRVP